MQVVSNPPHKFHECNHEPCNDYFRLCNRFLILHYEKRLYGRITVTPRGIEPLLLVRQTSVIPLHHEALEFQL